MNAAYAKAARPNAIDVISGSLPKVIGKRLYAIDAWVWSDALSNFHQRGIRDVRILGNFTELPLAGV